jgi:hypothetical protein
MVVVLRVNDLVMVVVLCVNDLVMVVVREGKKAEDHCYMERKRL